MLKQLYASIDIAGGLGNQLSQIAFILHFLKFSKQDGKLRELVIKYEGNLENKFGLPRKTFWDTLFKDQFNVLQEHDYKQITFDQTFYQGEHHKMEALPYNADKNILFKGYFQSFKYIDDDIREQMINYIYSNEDLMYTVYDKYNEIKKYFGEETSDNDMISMHVRRTDYCLDASYHYNLYLDYYKEALHIANKKYVVVFSDDIEWCKKNIGKNVYPYDHIYFIENNSVEFDFILMSMFQHNIIANSTFSLWASFISSYKDKIIIAPKTWNGPAGPQDWSEIYHNRISLII